MTASEWMCHFFSGRFLNTLSLLLNTCRVSFHQWLIQWCVVIIKSIQSLVFLLGQYYLTIPCLALPLRYLLSLDLLCLLFLAFLYLSFPFLLFFAFFFSLALPCFAIPLIRLPFLSWACHPLLSFPFLAFFLSCLALPFFPLLFLSLPCLTRHPKTSPSIPMACLVVTWIVIAVTQSSPFSCQHEMFWMVNV